MLGVMNLLDLNYYKLDAGLNVNQLSLRRSPQPPTESISAIYPPSETEFCRILIGCIREVGLQPVSLLILMFLSCKLHDKNLALMSSDKNPTKFKASHDRIR
jgi:hypothetical protein